MDNDNQDIEKKKQLILRYETTTKRSKTEKYEDVF